MRVLYITTIDFAAPTFSGFKRKIEEQLLSLSEMGHEVHIVYRHGYKIMHDNEAIYYRGRRYQYFLLLFKIKSFLRNNGYKYDLIYIRKFWFFPWLLPVFKFFRKISTYVLVEIPTYPYKGEYVNTGILNAVFLKLDSIGIKSVTKYLTKWVTFSDYERIAGLPAIKIRNGLNISSMPFLGFNKDRSFEKKHIHLLGVAAVSNYHAYDRVVEGIRIYSSNAQPIKVTFDIVGDGTHISYLKDKVNQYKLNDTVIFHGYQPKEDLPRYYCNADVLIGTLGFHRIGIKGSSPLKMAEYLAIGKPSIWSFDMKDYNNNGYMKVFPMDDSPISIDEIINWYREFPYLPEDIRAYAEENFSWQSQYERIFSELCK